MLWSAAQRGDMLKGSSALAASEERAAALAAEWASLEPLLSADGASFPPSVWNERAFGDALAVVLACSVYLPAAECFALLPLLSGVSRRAASPSGGGVSAQLDFDAGLGAVVLLATAPMDAGQRVVAVDAQQRNSAELLLCAGETEADFPGDTLSWTASLVPTDKLYGAKSAALEAAGLLAEGQTFPLSQDRMPTQLLAFLRLARVTDVGEMMKVRFDSDGAPHTHSLRSPPHLLTPLPAS